MDWFEQLTGFRETDYASTVDRLEVRDGFLISRVNGRKVGIGNLALRSLADLRVATAHMLGGGPRTQVRCVSGDARSQHCMPAHAGALFQVASQFNLLEMISPNVTPEQGVTRYAHDATQGPACAIAAAGGTIYRNYFAPVNGIPGQTATRQINALAALGDMLSESMDCTTRSLWEMRNGYALCTPDGLRAIGKHLRSASPSGMDYLRGALAIGLHSQVEVTDTTAPSRHCVTQAYCSALPVAYTRIPAPDWVPFAQLVLEAAYEATLLAAAEQRHAGGSNTVLLTRLGGGAFGNDARWIDAAIDRALVVVANAGLDVCLVSYAQTDPHMQAICDRWASAECCAQQILN